MNELEELLARIADGRAKIEDALQRLAKMETAALMLINNQGAQLPHMVSLFGTARRVTDDLKEAVKPVNELTTEMKEVRIPEVFARDEARTHTALNGDRVSLSTKVYASIPAERRPAAYAWLEENGHGDLIQRTVNSSTLNAFAKSYQEDQGKDLPGDLFTVLIRQEATLTKGKPQRT